MTISWTGFAKGNINAAIKMTVTGLILGSLATPLYIKWLMGTVIEIPLGAIFKQIILIVFLPMLAGQITQKIIIKIKGAEKYQKEIKQKFPPVSTIGVLGIVFTAMALKAELIVKNPLSLLYLIIPLIILYAVNFAVSTITAKLFFQQRGRNSTCLRYSNEKPVNCTGYCDDCFREGRFRNCFNNCSSIYYPGAVCSMVCKIYKQDISGKIR